MKHSLFIPALLMTLTCASLALAQSDSEEPDFDACGTLVRVENCVLFEGGGGKYVLSDYEGYQVGEAVRVIGFLDESCITICGDTADGCIRGAVVYDPTVFPCGTPVQIPFDPCSALSTGLTLLTAAGFIASRRKR